MTEEFRPYKFLVVSVIQRLDEDGQVVGEMVSEEPTPVFGVEGLRRYADSFGLELSVKMQEVESG